MDLQQGNGKTLTERQRAILKLIVQEYVATGRPVGSKTLTERYPVGVSSATIRHEMGELEEAGYVLQPHTSGGRVPTDHGDNGFYVVSDGDALYLTVHIVSKSEAVAKASQHQLRKAG